MCVATPIEYNPRALSKANSLAMKLRAGEELVRRTMLLRALRESDLTRASTNVPGSQMRMAMSNARAGQTSLEKSSGLKICPRLDSQK